MMIERAELNVGVGWRRQHARLQRGVTLVEVMIVVVILGLISAGAAVAIFPRLREAQQKTTRTSAQELRRAAETWRGTHASDICPTPQTLVQDKLLDSSSTVNDAWGTPFRIVCEEEETVVFSLGPDKKESADDIRVPEAPKAQ